jgi:site-specific DNA-cytosine methylase
MWKINGRELNEDTIVNTITCNMDRTHCAALFPYVGAKGDSYRRPTIREAFLLMGFTEEEYEKTAYLEYSYRKMNKLIGNSIVVDVLAEVFRAMFADRV